MFILCLYSVCVYNTNEKEALKNKKGVAIMTKNKVVLSTSDNRLLNQFKASIDTTSKATAESYTNAVKQYLQFIEKYGMNPQSTETVKEYKRHLLGLGYKASTVNSYITSIKRFYVYLEEVGACKNVAKKVKKVHETKDFKKSGGNSRLLVAEMKARL